MTECCCGYLTPPKKTDKSAELPEPLSSPQCSMTHCTVYTVTLTYKLFALKQIDTITLYTAAASQRLRLLPPSGGVED